MRKYCCENIKLVENYQLAKANNFKCWVIHHRLETHTSDGEERLVELTRFELDALGMYYNRPASELIYLTRGQHNTIHKKDKPCVGNIGHKVSEETKRKMSKVDKSYMQTDAYKVAHRAGIAKSNYKVSDETKKKMSERRQGNHWYNNGTVEILAKACPSGYKKGRIKQN